MNNPTRPHRLRLAGADAYREMAADKNREREAEEWVEGLIEDIADEPEPNARN